MKTTSLSDQRHWRFQREQSREMRDCDWEYRLRPPESWISLVLNGIGFGMFIGAVIIITCGI